MERKRIFAISGVKNSGKTTLILLEGFKYSTYPKIEIIRKGNSAESVCNPEKLMAIATNLDAEERDALSVLENVPFFELDNAECIAEFILSDYFR